MDIEIKRMSSDEYNLLVEYEAEGHPFVARVCFELGQGFDEAIDASLRLSDTSGVCNAIADAIRRAAIRGYNDDNNPTPYN